MGTRFTCFTDKKKVQILTQQVSTGTLSFFTVCYFTFVTISTVGYGDFAPKTIMGRLWVMVMILGGVAFFSMETGPLESIASDMPLIFCLYP
jgi:hypothetical protein